MIGPMSAMLPQWWVGASATVRVRVVTPSGVPVPVAALAFTMSVKQQLFDRPASIKIAGAPNASEGPNVVDFVFAAAATKNLTWVNGLWDVWIVDAVPSVVGAPMSQIVPPAPFRLSQRVLD